jgi:GST-like protein
MALCRLHPTLAISSKGASIVIRLHTAATPNGRKVSIALEELGLDYEVKRVNLAAEEQLKPKFLALNPNHKIPVLEDGDRVIWESGAILLHLGEERDPEGRILPRDAAIRMDAIQYAFFQTGGVGPNLGRLGQALRKEGEKNEEMIAIFSGELARLIGVLERILSDGRDYLAGPYSIGDIMHFPWLKIVLDLKAPALLERGSVVAWLERIGDRPAVQRGMAIPE